jgi:pilus assembly protein Flp/PilA
MGIKLIEAANLEADDRGATATEYGLLVGFIGMIIVVGVALFGAALDAYYGGLATWLASVI